MRACRHDGIAFAGRVAMGAHAARRLGGFDYRGVHAYFVTCCTYRRIKWFENPDHVTAVTQSLLQLAPVCLFDVPAYCFMPDHVHLLLEATSEESSFCRLMNLWKQKTGYAHKQFTREPLWQQGYYEHVLRQDEDRIDVVAYLLGNPLRAELVEDLRAYPFWGSGIWSREELLQAVLARGGRAR